MTPDLHELFPNASPAFLRMNGYANIPLPPERAPARQISTPTHSEALPLTLSHSTPDRDSGVISLTLPFPPSANNYWRTRVVVPKGKKPMAITYVTNEAREYKEKIGLIASTLVKQPFTCEVQMHIRLFRPRRIGDTSNYTKVLEDALQGACYVNDAQIGITHSERFDDKENPRVEVIITPRP